MAPHIPDAMERAVLDCFVAELALAKAGAPRNDGVDGRIRGHDVERPVAQRSRLDRMKPHAVSNVPVSRSRLSEAAGWMEALLSRAYTHATGC